MKRARNESSNRSCSHDQTKIAATTTITTTIMPTTTTTMTVAVATNSRNNEPRTVSSTNIIHSVMDIGRRSILEIRNQVSNFPRFMEDPTRHQHVLYFYEHPTFHMPSNCLIPSFRHQLNQLPCVLYPPTIPIYLFNFSNSRIPVRQCLPYHINPLFQMQPESAEASSLSCRPEQFLWSSHFWVSPQRYPLMECNGERGHHSRTHEPRVVQPLGQATRLGEGVSGTGDDFNDCYALSSTMLYFAPTCNSDSRSLYPPIFHVPLKPETSKDRQQSIKYQNFPSPPRIRYYLAPPDSLLVYEENPLVNLCNMLQADLALKRPRYLLEDIKYEPYTTSSISSVHHSEGYPECISLGNLHHNSPQQGMSKYAHQTQEYDCSSSMQESSDDEAFMDVESIEN